MSEANHHDVVPSHDLEREEHDMSIETPPEDAAEQHAAVSAEESEEDRPRWSIPLPFDADAADAADQRRQIELDEDDYR